MKKQNLQSAYSSIKAYWDPHVVASLNGQQVKVAKVKGQFPMHKHEHEDELFYIHKGELWIHFEDKESIHLQAGELLVVPRNTLHAPEAKEECEILLFEPDSTLNTGDQENEFTRRELKRLD